MAKSPAPGCRKSGFSYSYFTVAQGLIYSGADALARNLSEKASSGEFARFRSKKRRRRRFDHEDGDAAHMFSGEHHLKRVVAGLVEGDAVECHDDMWANGSTGATAGDFERTLGLEKLSPIGVHESHLQRVVPLFSEVGEEAKHEDHGRVAHGEVSGPDGVEDAQDIEFPFLADVGGIGDHGEVELHGRQASAGVLQQQERGGTASAEVITAVQRVSWSEATMESTLGRTDPL